VAVKNLFVFGASGHAKVVIEILERMRGVKVAFAVDDNAGLRGEKICGYPIIGGRDALVAGRRKAPAGIVTIGENGARERVAAWLAGQGFRWHRAIHPSAAVSKRASIGDGSVVMAGVVINADARIGAHVIVNTSATVDHDCLIGDCVHVAPGCHLCGDVRVGAGTLLGAGTTIIPGVRIGAHVVVGAGSTVVQDIPDGARVAGSPCRPVGS